MFEVPHHLPPVWWFVEARTPALKPRYLTDLHLINAFLGEGLSEHPFWQGYWIASQSFFAIGYMLSLRH